MRRGTVPNFLLAKWDTNRIAEDGLCVVHGGPERRLSALRRRPGGRAHPSAICRSRGGGGGGAGAAGEGTRDHRGGREGVRPLASGGHDTDGKWWITDWAPHFKISDPKISVPERTTVFSSSALLPVSASRTQQSHRIDSSTFFFFLTTTPLHLLPREINYTSCNICFFFSDVLNS